VRLLFDHLVRALSHYVASGKEGTSRRGGQARDDVLYPRTLRSVRGS